MELINDAFVLIGSDLPTMLIIIVGVGLWQSLRGCFNFGV